MDSLVGNPSVTNNNTSEVTSVVWTMGIPSVKKYKIDCGRTYANVNSSSGFIRGDRKLAYFSGVTNSSNSTNSTGFTAGTILIQQNAIVSLGEYTYDANSFSTNTNNFLQ